MSQVAVLCATRGNPSGLTAMIASVRATSHAAVWAYVDEDDVETYRDVDRGLYCVGPRAGPVASLNALAKFHPEYDAYVAATDDCKFATPGWDNWVLGIVSEKPVCAISPYVRGTRAMSFPCVSKEWIARTGWLAYPRAYHFCWDTIVELLAEPIGLVRARDYEFEIEHRNHTSRNLMEHFEKDARSFLFWCVKERHETLDRLRVP